MDISTIVNHLPKGVHRAALVARKFSPEILTGLGIVSGIGCVVSACRATLKVNDILDEHEDVKSDIAQAYEMGLDGYSERDAKRDNAIATVQTAGHIVKNYAPAIGLGAVSVTCVLGAHGILNKRNAALSAAYSLIQGKFQDYRGRVRQELGEAKDKQFYYGLKAQEVTVEETNPETGRKKKVKKEILVKDPNGYSKYAKCFDEGSPRWEADPELNLLFLRCQQNYANDLLHSRGHVFLNEVYDALGIPRTSEGAVVGWVLSKDGSTDNFIDFGIYSIENQMAADFVNGYESNIWLDFNVDGLIYDLI